MKPSREVHAGDLLQIRTESGDFTVQVLGLAEMRGPASVAQRLYRETEESLALRLKTIEERRAMASVLPTREGKPSKRERRDFDRFRGRA